MVKETLFLEGTVFFLWISNKISLADQNPNISHPLTVSASPKLEENRVPGKGNYWGDVEAQKHIIL